MCKVINITQPELLLFKRYFLNFNSIFFKIKLHNFVEKILLYKLAERFN